MNFIRSIGAFCLVLGITTRLMAQDASPVPVRILLNTVDKGEYIVMLNEQGVVFVRSAALEAMGVNLPLGSGVEMEGEMHIPLEAMKDRIDHRLDLTTLILHIDTDPSLMGRRIFDYGPDQNTIPPDERHPSAYLNHSLEYQMGNDEEFIALNLPWEVAARWGSTLFQSTFLYKRTKAGDEILEDSVRLLSNLSWDYQSVPSRLTLGDIHASSDQLGGSGLFAGIHYGTNFALVPKFSISPLLTLTGVAQTPSQLEIYVNNSVVKREFLTPGEFELRDIPQTSGAGDVVLVLRDAFGREQRIVTSFFNPGILLKPGLHDYRYTFGSSRRNLGKKSNQYGPPAVFAYHRLGLTSFLTMGLRGEAGTNENQEVGKETIENQVVNYGTSASLSLGPLGGLTLNGAYSKERDEEREDDSIREERTGRAGALNYSFPSRWFNFSFSSQSRSRDYANLSLSALDDKPSSIRSASIGLNLRALGSLSLSWNRKRTFLENEQITRTANYSFSLFKWATLVMRSTSKTTFDDSGEEEETLSGSASLLIPLGESHSMSLRGDEQDGVSNRAFSFQSGSTPLNGFGYRYNGERTRYEDSEDSVRQDVHLEYMGQYGIYSTTVNKIDDLQSSRLKLASSVAWIDGSVHLTRPLRDAFALVRVGELEGVPVLSRNQIIGTTNKDGEVIVPDLVSYRNNTISLSENEIPIEFTLSNPRANLVPPHRGGAVVDFQVARLQAFIGSLSYRQDGEKRPAELSVLEYTVGGETIETFVGRGGEFYLENLPAGTYPAHVFDQKSDCRFDLTIPDSQETIVELGEVTCETR